MGDLKFTSFGGPSKALESNHVIDVLESGSSYRQGSPHSDLLREAKAAINGIKLYIIQHCRPQLKKQNKKDMSPQQSKEYGSRVSND
jgi:hypothetical protein